MAARFRQDHLLHPDRIAVGSENPPTQTVEIWHDIADQPHVIGDFVRTGWDYGRGRDRRGPLQRPSSVVPAVPRARGRHPNFDITGHRHTQTYLNEIAGSLRAASGGAAGRPCAGPAGRLQLALHRLNPQLELGRAGRRTRDGRGVMAQTVWAELSLNGVPVGAGRYRRSPHLVSFTVPYAPGELTAVLRGTDGTEIGRDTCAVPDRPMPDGAGRIRIATR